MGLPGCFTSRASEFLAVTAPPARLPMVVVPGGGDQWEMANRVVRQGSAQLIRPLGPEALAAAVREVLSCPGYAEAARAAGAGVVDVADPVRVCQDAVR